MRPREAIRLGGCAQSIQKGECLLPVAGARGIREFLSHLGYVGVADAIGYDTTGDGKIDALDTNLDGRIECARARRAALPRSQRVRVFRCPACRTRRGSRVCSRTRSGYSSARRRVAPTPTCRRSGVMLDPRHRCR